jgi:hypothetical protein
LSSSSTPSAIMRSPSSKSAGYTSCCSIRPSSSSCCCCDASASRLPLDDSLSSEEASLSDDAAPEGLRPGLPGGCAAAGGPRASPGVSPGPSVGGSRASSSVAGASNQPLQPPPAGSCGAGAQRPNTPTSYAGVLGTCNTFVMAPVGQPQRSRTSCTCL